MRLVLLVLVLGIALGGVWTLQGTVKISGPAMRVLPTATSQPIYYPTEISLERIFSDQHQWTATLSAQKVITVIATGDVMVGRTVNDLTIESGDFTWAWEKTADYLKSADLTFINLETPLLPSCPTITDRMVFCADKRHIEGLTAAGVDVVNLANNHTANYGAKGIESTKKILDQAGILNVGTGGIVYRAVRDKKLAFLGYDDTVGPVDTNKVRKEIKDASQSADLVIVAFHWGTEYTSQPTSGQINLAHLAIDAGADLVIGNHPHWIQPVEIYKGKLIAYAHGNFIFDQEWSEKTKEGVVGRYTFYDNRLIDAQFLPIKIEGYGQPGFVTGSEGARILNEMKEESNKLLRKVSRISHILSFGPIVRHIDIKFQ
jgi:poly-gamma-glutamate synthesis protein (capsule biosynthesis protein)